MITTCSNNRNHSFESPCHSPKIHRRQLSGPAVNLGSGLKRTQTGGRVKLVYWTSILIAWFSTVRQIQTKSRKIAQICFSLNYTITEMSQTINIMTFSIHLSIKKIIEQFFFFMAHTFSTLCRIFHIEIVSFIVGNRGLITLRYSPLITFKSTDI